LVKRRGNSARRHRPSEDGEERGRTREERGRGEEGTHTHAFIQRLHVNDRSTPRLGQHTGFATALRASGDTDGSNRTIRHFIGPPRMTFVGSQPHRCRCGDCTRDPNSGEIPSHAGKDLGRVEFRRVGKMCCNHTVPASGLRGLLWGPALPYYVVHFLGRSASYHMLDVAFRLPTYLVGTRRG
jgi:hypothetical protein